MNRILIVYLFAVNLFAFILYGMDKNRAKRGEWRIKEKTLLGVAVIGGSIGALLGMHIFHHMTKHVYFLYGIPAVLFLQVLGAVLVYFR